MTIVELGLSFGVVPAADSFSVDRKYWVIVRVFPFCALAFVRGLLPLIVIAVVKPDVNPAIAVVFLSVRWKYWGSVGDSVESCLFLSFIGFVALVCTTGELGPESFSVCIAIHYWYFPLVLGGVLRSNVRWCVGMFG